MTGVDWIIVQMHQDATSSSATGNGSDLGIRQAWLPLFDQYQVDLVLCGHDHDYERSFPVRGFDVRALVLMFVGAVLMRGAGCTFNDIVDRDIDDKVARTRSRPIPSGQVSTKQAAAFLAVQALLGCATRGGMRREIFRESMRVIARCGPYAGSIEELTPVRRDWISAVPLAMITLALLANPKLAGTLSKKGWGAHLLGIESIRLIERENFSRGDA